MFRGWPPLWNLEVRGQGHWQMWGDGMLCFAFNVWLVHTTCPILNAMQWLGRGFPQMGLFQLFSMVLKFSMGHFLSFYTDFYGPFSKLMGLWRMAPCLPNHWQWSIDSVARSGICFTPELGREILIPSPWPPVSLFPWLPLLSVHSGTPWWPVTVLPWWCLIIRLLYKTPFPFYKRTWKFVN